MPFAHLKNRAIDGWKRVVEIGDASIIAGLALWKNVTPPWTNKLSSLVAATSQFRIDSSTLQYYAASDR